MPDERIKCRILIVDDEREITEILADLLSCDYACTVAGCTASHEDKGQTAVGNAGYYAPLKENTNRFVKREP